MKRDSVFVKAMAIVLFVSSLVPAVSGSSLIQREKRPISRGYASTSIATDSGVLPVGLVMVLKLETRLDSGTSRTSDRFRARLVQTISDDSGRDLVPLGAIVEGFVEAVTPAQLRRRSGVISVRFDMLRLPDGRALPIEGVLTSIDPNSRKKVVDDENNLSGGSTTKQSIVFIGGGAGVGAAVGAIAGGALMGVGVGAAAGAVGAWLAKGKEAIVEPGTRIGLLLSKPVDLSIGGSGITRLDPRATAPAAPVPQPAPPPPSGKEQFVRRTPEVFEAPKTVPAELGARIGDKLEVFTADFAQSIGARRRPDGAYEFDKQMQIRQEEVELLFAVSNLSDTAQLQRGLMATDATGDGWRGGAGRLATQAREVDQRWRQLKPGPDLDRKWQALQTEIRQLEDAAR